MKSRVSMGRKSVEKENLGRCSVSRGKLNRCVIFPASVCMVAEALERRNNNWIVRTKTESDLIIQIEDSSFYLHKLPIVSKSGYLNRLVFQSIITSKDKTNIPIIQIENLPGGIKSFELVVKFCYGWKIDVTSTDIATLYSTAHFLEMDDDFELGNLISKTEAFLSFIIFSSWKDTFCVLKGCESIPTWAQELQILKRCMDTIAWKACTNPKSCFLDTKEEIDHDQARSIDDTWWLEDVSSLRIDHFIKVIESIKRKGMRSELIGSCITKWLKKWLLQITSRPDIVSRKKDLSHDLGRVTIESLIQVLPEEENSVSRNFLLYLLKLGLVMKISIDLSNKLERRIALTLEQYRVQDLLIKNYGENDSVYDVGIVTRVVKHYISLGSGYSNLRILDVGKLVNDYLTLIATDKNLKAKSFQLLAEVLPKCARKCDDNLYRAIDIYLKAHPDLTEEERTMVCRVLEYHKLSHEARQHAIRNDRLSSKITMQFVLLEQVNMARSMIAVGSDYRRTKIQTIIRVSKNSDKGWMSTSQNEIKMMKREVEKIKVQLNQLHMCKVDLKKQVKRYIS